MHTLGTLILVILVALVTRLVVIGLKKRQTVGRNGSAPPRQKSVAKAGRGTKDRHLSDHEPSDSLRCFPTINPITGRKLEFDRQSDAAALEKAGLPVANSIDDLAALMGVQPGELKWLMTVDANHYTPIELRGGGKRRLIFAPKSKMKACQRWILKNILNKVPVHPAAHGFCKGKCILTHAWMHSGKYSLLTLDIHRFFDTVRSKRVYGVYRKMGYSEEAALALCLLTTRKGRLPQGAPTSPALANLVCRKMDARLNGLSMKFNATYSRYADDMAFSGDPEFAERRKIFMHMVSKILHEEKFRLNPQKTRFMRQGSRQYMTGLVINKSPGIPRERLRKIRAILHNSKNTGLDAQNRANRKAWPEYLRGYISYISMINPEKGRLFANELDQINQA